MNGQADETCLALDVQTDDTHNACTNGEETTGEPMDDLRSALTANQGAVERALRDAEQEFKECQAHCVELQRLIERAQMVLGIKPLETAPSTNEMPMHEAMALVLAEHPGGLPPVELLKEINKRHLYATRSGQPPAVGQIHARVGSYPHLFARENGLIKLKDGSGSIASQTSDRGHRGPQ